jgi:hypothetical protein
MIKLYFANPGAGKTTFLAKTAQKYNKPTRLSIVLNKLSFGKIKKKKKYENVYCTAPIWNTLEYDVDRDMGIKHIENSLILIDEGAIVLDNRVPLTKPQKTFLRLHRHYKCDIICTSQSWEDINIVVRRLYDKIYLMNRTLLKHTTTIREISKKIDIDEDGNIKDSYHFKFFIFGFRFFRRKKFYRYFNSYDKPQLEPKTGKLSDVKYQGVLPKTKTQKLIINFSKLLNKIKNLTKRPEKNNKLSKKENDIETLLNLEKDKTA